MKEDGYVRLVDSMGDELSIVNAARVSFDKESKELDKKDIGLLKFLVKHKHDSVLRHNFMTFEVFAPLMVARQWFKHTVASTHLDDQMGRSTRILEPFTYHHKPSKDPEDHNVMTQNTTVIMVYTQLKKTNVSLI